ncbi:EGF [Nesidiocoris tenuis]|uniref:EGF n=1 Tax=Nesidiocoris tenuis TaxID=355587 RepID=A0ABN7AVP6_9HEMI|nr:EGF [Nesidiocoris tenuis]
MTRLKDGCSSRTMPRPRPPTTTTTTTTATSTTARVSTARPNVTYNTYPCEPGYDTSLCLNGGTCFIVKVTDTGLYNCMCADGFVGQRCEYKNLDGSYMPPRHVVLETASIASCVTIAVFLVVVICMYLYMHAKRRQKSSQSSSDEELSNDLERRSARSSFSAKKENPTAPRLPLHHVTTESGSETAGYPVYAETSLTPPPIREVKEPP